MASPVFLGIATVRRRSPRAAIVLVPITVPLTAAAWVLWRFLRVWGWGSLVLARSGWLRFFLTVYLGLFGVVLYRATHGHASSRTFLLSVWRAEDAAIRRVGALGGAHRPFTTLATRLLRSSQLAQQALTQQHWHASQALLVALPVVVVFAFLVGLVSLPALVRG